MSARFYIIYLCDFSNMFIQENYIDEDTYKHILIKFKEIISMQ